MQAGNVVADRFVLVHLAANVGTAAVFRATDQHTQQPVALKVAYGRHAKGARRFEREAECLRQLDHPGVVRYVAHGASSGVAYLALEWLEGEDLAHRLERVGLSLQESVSVIAGIAGGLAHAHAHSVVHRDIKPESVLLVARDASRVKLVEFGLAGGLGGGSWDQLQGAPPYMSPEQLHGGRTIDERTDVFSLGCVLYECLSGARPFRGETLMEIVSSVTMREPEPLPPVAHEIGGALSALVSQMLAKDPSDRPAAAAVARELSSMLQRLLPTSGEPAKKAAPFMSDERRLVCAAVAQPPRGAAPQKPPSTVLMGALEDRDALHAVRDIATAFGATVSPVPGMGMVIVPDERYFTVDQVVLVARCALALKDAIPDLRIGVAARREVVQGRWLFGEAVKVASELADKGAAEILVDDVAAGLIGPRFETVKIQSDDDFRLIGFHASDDAAAAREPQLLGRDADLARLRQRAYDVIQHRRPHATLIIGPSGQGKSRIARELTRELRQGQQRVGLLVGRGDPIGAGSPFSLAAQALRGALDMSRSSLAPGSDSPERQRATLASRLIQLGLVEDQPRISAYLGALLGLPIDEPTRAYLAWALQDPALMADGIRWAFCEWLRVEAAAVNVLVLLLEDLHWGDYPSVRVIEHALSLLAGSPLLVLALGRPEVLQQFPDLGRLSNVDKLYLGGLSDEDAVGLVRERLGGRGNPTLIRRIVTQAAGNPLFLHELASTAEDQATDSTIPETVLTTAQANLERLDPFARRVLRAASVFGEVFWGSGVVFLLGTWHADETARWLPHLQQLGIIERRPGAELGAEIGYSFHHDLLREAAYAMLSEEDRIACHRLAAEWLELHADADALALAEQWVRGGAPARAVEWYRRAAHRAIGGNDFRGAIDYVERAARCGARGELLGELRLIAAEALEWATDNEARDAAAQQALEHLAPGSPPWFSAFHHALVARLRLHGPGAVGDLCDELDELADGMIPTAEEVIALARVGGYLTMYGDEERGRHFSERAERRATALTEENSLVMGWLAWARAWRAQSSGDIARCLQHEIQSMFAFEEAGDQRYLCYARSNVGYTQMRLGLLEESQKALQQSLQTAERLDLKNIASGASHNLGLVLALCGQLDRALITELRALALFASLKSGRGETTASEYLTRIHLMRGELDDAEKCARRALEQARDWPSVVSLCSASLARVLLAKGDIGGALQEAEQAVSLLEVHGSADGEDLYIRCAHIEALERAGQFDRARATVSGAHHALVEAAMRIENEHIRHAFLTRVPEHWRIQELSRQLHI